MNKRCEVLIYRGGYYGSTCARKAVIERNGKSYCKQHDPVEVKRRTDERNAKWEAEWKAKEKRYAAAKKERELVEAKAALCDEMYKRLSTTKVKVLPTLTETYSDLFCIYRHFITNMQKLIGKTAAG